MDVTPEFVVAVPTANAGDYIGRRTRRWRNGQQEWPTITAVETSPFRHSGWDWVRIGHHDGGWGSHRDDLWVLIEATPEEHAGATVQDLGHGYGVWPLLDGAQIALF